MICAVRHGRVRDVRRLIAAGADISETDEAGLTPLHHAALRGYFHIAKLLARAGADVDAEEDEGFTPLHLAAGGGCLALSKLLVEAGADTEASAEGGGTPLHMAASLGKIERAKGPLRRAPRTPPPAAAARER